MTRPISNISTHQILLIDIGNTNVKWAFADHVAIGQLHRVCHVDKSIDELANESWSVGGNPSQVLLANVTGRRIEEQLIGWMVSHWGLSPTLVRPVRRLLGVTNGYTDPTQLGVDRWLTLLAVHQNLPGAACIVDCGTAITVDVLTKGGEHLGGMILPGLNLMREGLLSRTKIPRVEDVEVMTLLATDTATAVASAALNSAAALVERTMDRIGQDIADPVQLICTGNDTDKLISMIKYPARIEHDLVMQGLHTLAQQGIS